MKVKTCRLIIIVVLTFFGLASNCSAQGVLDRTLSIDFANTELGIVLQEIESLNKIHFAYSAQIIPIEQKVSIKGQNRKLSDLLNELFKPFRITYELLGNDIILRVPEENPSPQQGNLFNQNKVDTNISGRVLSESGEILPGVTILLKGTKIGATTDLNARFNLKIPKIEGTLIFSFIGFETKEIPVGGLNWLEVKMTPASKGLEEVIIVAYGTQKKETVTGAIASIKTREIKQSPAANLAITLAGRLPGLTALQRSGEPGRELIQVFIRGQGTINDQNPIILVDGVERELNYIDPNEVETITILKDASSTALFGVRGANGVILVTTKRGEAEVPEVNFTAESAIQNFTRLAKPVDAYAYASLRNLAQRNDGKRDAYSAEALEAYRTGSDPLRYPNTDWVNMLVKDFSLQQRYNLNVSGAGKAMRYFVNAGFISQDGQFKTEKGLNYDPGFRLNRYNFRANIDLQINKSLKAFLNIAGYLEKQNSPYGVSVASTGQEGLSPSFYILANLYDIPSNVPGPLTPDNSVVAEPTKQNPPYGILNRTGYRQQTRNNVTATYGMEQLLDFITPGLSAKAVASFDSRATNSLNAAKTYVRKVQVINPNIKGKDGKDSVYFRDFANDVESPLSISGTSGFSSLSNFQIFLNYNQAFGDHHIAALLLYQQQKNIIDVQLPFNLRGVSNRLTYGYKNKYFLEFNAGYNGSEQFIKGKRFGFFPAVSGGWIVSNENFWQGVKGLHFFKIRGSYGEVGNDRLRDARFLYLDNVVTSTGGYSNSLNGGQQVNIIQYKNEEVQWEVAKKINLGIELGFLYNFNLIVDLFKERRDNILRNRGTIPVLNGLANSVMPPVNIGVIENKGFEIELNYKKQFNKNFSFLSRLSLGYATNRQVFADEPLLTEDFAYRSRQQGYRIDQNFGYIVEKYFQDQDEINRSPIQQVGGHESRPGDFKYRDLNKDGFVNEKDMAPIGFSYVPEYTFGSAFSATLKSLDISVLFQGVANVSNYYQSRGTFATGLNYFSRHLESWTAERLANGEQINYPRLSTQASPNEIRNSFFIMDASYIRLKNMEIGYSFSPKILNRIKSKRMRVYVNGLNLITWDSLPTKDFDPELVSGLSYPVTRLYNVGLNLVF